MSGKSSAEVLRVMRNKPERKVFINSYKYFKKDKNDNVYYSFIESVSINDDSETIEDAVYLSDTLGYYSVGILKLVKLVLKSKRNFFLKLTCLDFIHSNYLKIGKTEYSDINESLRTNKNLFIKLQANVNLLLNSSNEKYRKSILTILSSSEYPNIFYRFLNMVDSNIPQYSKTVDVDFLKSVEKEFKCLDFSKSNIVEYIRTIINFIIQ